MGSELPKLEAAEASEPIPLIAERAAETAFPVEYLMGLKKVVRAVQAERQAPIALAANSALAAVSLLVQSLAQVEALEGYVPTSLFLMTIADSGERKSGCDGIFTRPIKEYQKNEAKELATKRKKHEDERNIFETRRKSLRDKISKENDPNKLSVFQLQLEELGAQPAPPPLPDRIINDATMQGLFRMYQEGSKSLGLINDEAAGFLFGYSGKSENRLHTFATLCNLWKSEPIQDITRGRISDTVYDCKLSLHLMMQPAVASRFLEDGMAKDQGLMARMLIAWPDTLAGTRFYEGGKNNQSEIDAYSAKAYSMLVDEKKHDEDFPDREPAKLRLSAAAKTKLISFYNEIEKKLAPGESLSSVRPNASKIAEQAVRLAAVLTLWDDAKAVCVEERAMLCGIALATYYLSEAKRLFHGAEIPQDIRAADNLRKWLIAKKIPDGIFAPQLVYQNGHPDIRDAQKAKHLLQILAHYKWLIPIDEPIEINGKKHNAAYKLNFPSTTANYLEK